MADGRDPLGIMTHEYVYLAVDSKNAFLEITTTYYELAKVHHPDHGGDQATFLQIHKGMVFPFNIPVISPVLNRGRHNSANFGRGQVELPVYRPNPGHGKPK